MNQRRKKRRKHPDEKFDVRFCTECGEQLDEFDFDPMSTDLDAVKHNHQNCKHNGKFKGEMCSKLFISSEEVTIINDEDED